MLFLLFLSCFVFAQIDEDPSVGTEEAYPEDDQAEQPPAESVPASSDDTFLDNIIGNQPVVPQPEAPRPATARPLPSRPAISKPQAAQPSSTIRAGSGPDIEEPPVRKVHQQRPVDNGVKYSSNPEIDEATLQENPDIPEFSHEDHIKDRGAECVQCHQTLFAESVRGVKSGPSMKEICSQCHNGSDAPAEVLVGFSDEKKYVKTYIPLFSHTKHLEHSERCTVCHQDIFGELKKIKTPPPMSICTECHNNGEASANCRVCHEDPGKLKPRSHTPRWVYRNGHGTDARYNQAQCRDCHVDRECSKCHRGQSTFGVHRPGYKYSHGMDARQRVVNCSYCHDVENSCAKCHERTR